MDELFPKFQKNIENLIEDQEGNIPGNKLLMLGTMVIILGSILSAEVHAAHRSHSSHKSHSSHGSGASDHSSHGSHTSHGSHESHVSHSNTASHSNSNMEGVASRVPIASDVTRITPPATIPTEEFHLPDINQNIEMPNGTPNSGIIPTLAIPASSVDAKIEIDKINMPLETETIE